MISRPTTNFQTFTPTKNIIQIPSMAIVNDVPRSGWIAVKIKGIVIIISGKNKLCMYPILSKRKSW